MLVCSRLNLDHQTGAWDVCSVLYLFLGSVGLVKEATKYMVPRNSAATEVPPVTCSLPGIYLLLLPLFLLHAFSIAPSSLFPSFPVLWSEGCGFVLSSSRFEIAVPASSSRTTTGAGHGLGCSTVPVLVFQHHGLSHTAQSSCSDVQELAHAWQDLGSVVGKSSCSTRAWPSLEVL